MIRPDGLTDFEALRRREAEAADNGSRQVLRDFKSDLHRQNFIPEQLVARGHKFVAEKMTYASSDQERQPHRFGT